MIQTQGARAIIPPRKRLDISPPAPRGRQGRARHIRGRFGLPDAPPRLPNRTGAFPDHADSAAAGRARGRWKKRRRGRTLRRGNPVAPEANPRAAPSPHSSHRRSISPRGGHAPRQRQRRLRARDRTEGHRSGALHIARKGNNATAWRLNFRDPARRLPHEGRIAIDRRFHRIAPDTDERRLSTPRSHKPSPSAWRRSVALWLSTGGHGRLRGRRERARSRGAWCPGSVHRSHPGREHGRCG